MGKIIECKFELTSVSTIWEVSRISTTRHHHFSSPKKALTKINTKDTNLLGPLMLGSFTEGMTLKSKIHPRSLTAKTPENGWLEDFRLSWIGMVAFFGGVCC